MKQLVLAGLLLAGLAGCKNGADPTPDPFLGRWKSEQSFIESRTLAGQLLTRSDFKADTMTLEVTATTLTFITRVSRVQVDYTRSGEVLTLPQSPNLQQYARNLTADSFTFNNVSTMDATTTRSLARDFHR